VLKARGIDKQLGVLLVGDGVLTNALKQQAKDLHLDNLVFVPSVPKTEALWVTGRCDIGYAGGRDLKTIYRYGISFNKVMDYMKYGLPVILPIDTKADPVSESGGGIVTGGDSPDAIADAIDIMVRMDSKQRSAMGKNGQVHIREAYDYAKIAQNYVDAVKATSAPSTQ
jgi:glycosyltransferase involved in cell wall biosynthesis